MLGELIVRLLFADPEKGKKSSFDSNFICHSFRPPRAEDKISGLRVCRDPRTRTPTTNQTLR